MRCRGVSEPVLYIRDVPIRIGEMDADRVPKDMNVAAIGRKVCESGVDVEQPIDLTAGERCASPATAAEEVRR